MSSEWSSIVSTLAEDDSSNGAPKSAHKQSEGPRRYAYHHGYIRIFQNGDEAGFNWNFGGGLYSQPPAFNYQQMSKLKRLKMTINGEPVAEIDIRASYLTLFHAWHGEQLDLGSDLNRPGIAGGHLV